MGTHEHGALTARVHALTMVRVRVFRDMHRAQVGAGVCPLGQLCAKGGTCMHTAEQCVLRANKKRYAERASGAYSLLTAVYYLSRVHVHVHVHVLYMYGAGIDCPTGTDVTTTAKKIT